jgi:hypothetical protein
MDVKDTHVSEQWLRAHVYERGKKGETDTSFGSHHLLRLAEARAALRDESSILVRVDCT